ncbi:MAG: 4-hydroxyphenylacetate isomerase [Armatimonadetes bacterium CG_4_10_14_3_um_filter_66_18]|nr:MAG: 4-hydroxyphenylacetate isomerase [Armatimonadetes bacterium CG06_land_8_20_14_3_00_66_21]PIW20176.1 MAG: 4-hydroxyphenylacetate isomerase [Armatimonadetes bacterium CG17_big_fil_post_rev_8_21_14_2_50_66_6]PIX36792.1 MAG: 4-hydroxyphenylacetate isomerase [Armatimonadetes bacterium CG_4_8_14_3_um_filter_66_20]PIY48217.1 MAG: 4-hydroxyphenylacetate isomerase [Armatimonadetes bacterium CG_4_10_14_3_um_filter_66_18]PIZ29367.1 MAG: 4-hydroxyphenylacetate isomerase [Armatimonadetes bacterium C
MSTDPFELRKLYQPLRVVDVCDAMDGIGYFDSGLMDPDVRPLWLGMKFWGVALTIRCVPANRPMWKLETTEDIVNAHGIWFKEVGHVGTGGLIKPGHVVVTDPGGAGEVGFWGSANSLGTVAEGAVGIVTDGYCRDTYEVALQKTPICARKRGRTIIPGRIEVVETQTRIGCGGVQVAPGDMVGCDDDGVVVVPQRIAPEVAVHARAILLTDMRARRKHYERLGREPDQTVDYEAVEGYYAELE